MAKSKKQTTTVSTNESSSYIASVLAQIESEYGEGIARAGQDLIDKPPQVISLGPAFDLCLGGGIPSGSFVSVSGPEGCAKTSTMMSFLANCQKPKYGSRPCMVLSAEHRMSETILQGTKGLDITKPMFTFIESTKGKILSAQDFLNIGLTFLKSVPGGVLLIDSVSALVNPRILEDGLGTADYGSGNKLLSQFCDLASSTVRANNCLVIGIVQYYANTTGRGAAWNEKAAKRWKYQSNLSIQCRRHEFDFGEGEDQPATGQEQEWLIRKCAFARPAGKVTSYIRYGVGIDRTREMYELGHGVGLLSGSGWVTLNYLEGKPELVAGTPFEEKDEVKIQGKANVVAAIEQYPGWLECLEQSLEAMTAV